MASASKEMEPMKPNTHGTMSGQFSCISKFKRNFILTTTVTCTSQDFQVQIPYRS